MAERILLVDDEPSIRILMRRLFEAAGYDVLEARNAHEALRLADEHHGGIQLLVSDIVMPDMDGFALERRLRAAHPRLKVLFLSGYAQESVEVRSGLKTAGQAFLLKPFTRNLLLEKVQQVLQAPAAG